MKCPVCEGNTKVVDVRERKSKIYRRRECLECGYRFATYEIENGQFSDMLTNIMIQSINSFIEREFPSLKARNTK
jgi:transcriptional regulator NrdR family protein